MDDSRTAFPITEAITEELHKANKNVRVTVGVSGINTEAAASSRA